MLDVAVAYNRFKFLGDEFLTWLWFIMENDPRYLTNLFPDLSSLEIGNRIVLENRYQKAVETITIKGDDANLEEAILALRKGAVVTELSFSLKSNDQEWQFTIKGESLNFSGFKIPFSAPVDTAEDTAGAVLEKVYLYDRVFQIIDRLYNDFIKTRVSNDWQNKVVPRMRKWITA